MGNPEYIKAIFEEEKNRLIRNIDEAKQIVQINLYLRQFNWAFVHPYLVGFNLESFRKMQEEGSGTQEAIFKIFRDYFFDLRHTAYFIDGFYRERPPLKPFCLLIDQSVMMCLQRDFAGAINLLITVIEGSLRHYLIHYHDKRQEKIMGTKDLLNAFELMKKVQFEQAVVYYKNRYYRFEYTGAKFDQNQAIKLAEYNREYTGLWFSIIIHFFSQNLYLDTRNGQLEDSLNRHSIFHGFSSAIYYNLDNYLRLFNVLHFLSWAYSHACPGVKYLPDMDEKLIVGKWKAFEKIKLASELVASEKYSVLSKHDEFNQLNNTTDLPPSSLEKQLPSLRKKSIEEKFRYIDRVIDSAYKNSI